MCYQADITPDHLKLTRGREGKMGTTGGGWASQWMSLFKIKTPEPPTQTVLAALLWEAALCFSLPTWVLSGNHAWPANNPYRFTFAVLAGATASLLLCHVVPALFAGKVAARQRGPLRVLAWMVQAWLAIGAAASAIWIARSLAQWFWWLLPNQTPLVGICAAVSLAAAVLVSRSAARWQMAVATTLGLLGLTLIVISVASQTRGLWMVTQQLSRGEDALGNDLEVFKGILLASAPASIFAFRVGKSGLTRRAVVWTGLWAIWLPLVCSVTLVAWAKMCGVRLYWKPSIPIGVEFAFAWLAPTAPAIGILLIILSLVSMTVPVFWVSDLVRGATLPRRVLALAAVGIIGLWLTFPDGILALGHYLPPLADQSSLQGYYLPWCWSILTASALYGAWKALMSLIARGSGQYAGSRPHRR
jgi:hypothetical protein